MLKNKDLNMEQFYNDRDLTKKDLTLTLEEMNNPSF